MEVKGEATGLMVQDLNHSRAQDFSLLQKTSRLAMRPMQPPVQGVKGKAVPLQAWSGPEVSRKLRYPDFMRAAQDGGKVVSLTQRPPLPPGNTPGTHFC